MKMEKKNKNWIWIVAIVVGVYMFSKGGLGGIGQQAMTGSETMTRTGPSSVNAGNPFSLTYTAVGTSGTWGASIEDSVTGGCTFPSGAATYKTVMLSEDGTTKTITITAPASGSCTFTGDYQFGTFPIAVLNPYSISVCVASCTCASTTCTGNTCSNGCGGNCAGTKAPVCTRPSDLCIESLTVSNGCLLTTGSNGNCAGSWTVTKKTSADTDCNNIISRVELGTAINDWVAGTFSRADLGTAIMSWAGG